MLPKDLGKISQYIVGKFIDIFYSLKLCSVTIYDCSRISREIWRWHLAQFVSLGWFICQSYFSVVLSQFRNSDSFVIVLFCNTSITKFWNSSKTLGRNSYRTAVTEEIYYYNFIDVIVSFSLFYNSYRTVVHQYLLHL